jgi:hypothetical protein
MLSLKEKIAKNYINAIGWSTKKKFLLIESDDWGAVRMPSREVYDKLVGSNIQVDKVSFDKHDAVESEEDLLSLFKTLQKFTDKKGNPAVLTAYHVVANPDFNRIEATQKKEYHYETILDTYARHEHTRKVPELIKFGMKAGIYIPQFHGREHIHVKRYMEAINSASEKEQIAFKNKAIISSKSVTCTKPYTKGYFKGFGFSSSEEYGEIEAIHRDGLKIFKDIFGRPSVTFMAQGSVWGDHILPMLKEDGVQLVSGQQSVPFGDAKLKQINKKWGSKNKLNQLHWRRNCMFEPGRNQNFDWVGKCLEEIEIAFKWGKPAVISAHRENFIGSIFEENRVETLQKMEMLLAQVLKRWPDVQFISTDELAKIMLENNKFS